MVSVILYINDLIAILENHCIRINLRIVNDVDLLS